MAGEPWGGTASQLDSLVNPDDLSRLLVFDTWTLNCDRHYPRLDIRKPNYDNVFLASEGLRAGQRRLIAMDHGLTFIRSGEELTTKLARLEKVREEALYGLFPEFKTRLRQRVIDESCRRLGEMDQETARAIVDTVPQEWEVSTEVRRAWVELICRRAEFVADNFRDWIKQALSQQGSTGA